MLARSLPAQVEFFNLPLRALLAGAIALLLAVAGTASAQPTLDTDLRTTFAAADPPAGSETEDGAGFTPFNSIVSWGGPAACSTPPNDPTFTSVTATQNSTVSPLSYSGTGTATAVADGGSCGCSVTAISGYHIVFTADASYDVAMSGTFEDGNFTLSAQAGSTFVSLVGFTGTHSDTLTIPPGTYDLNAAVLVVASFAADDFGTVETSFDFSVQLSPSVAVGVAEGPAASPTLFLMAPQPNPSRSVTFLGLDLDRTADVSLTVYDLSGRVVRKLVDGPLAAGRHRVSWDGRDQRGSRVASGMYFLRALTEGRSTTRRIIRLD